MRRFVLLAPVALAASTACSALSGLNDYTRVDCRCDAGLRETGAGADTFGGDGSAEDDAPDDGAEETTSVDAGSGEANEAVDAATGTPDAGEGGDAATDSRADGGEGGIGSGLVAYYAFDESTGTAAQDSSGRGNTATLMGSASFAAGVRGNAVNLNGTSGYVALPSGVVAGLPSFSIASWVYLNATPVWSRVFDFGTGTTTYMFLTPNSGQNTRFAITTGGNTQEQQANAGPLGANAWHHVAVTLAANTATLYVDGASVATHPGTTLSPSSLGTTNQNWIGRSQYAGDSYLNGRVDNFRIYDRALAAAEVQALCAGHL